VRALRSTQLFRAKQDKFLEELRVFVWGPDALTEYVRCGGPYQTAMHETALYASTGTHWREKAG